MIKKISIYLSVIFLMYSLGCVQNVKRIEEERVIPESEKDYKWYKKHNYKRLLVPVVKPDIYNINMNDSTITSQKDDIVLSVEYIESRDLNSKYIDKLSSYI